MASNARFHNKYHRRNHHTLPSAGYPDSGADPIASPQEPFLGDFHAVGALSATGNLTIGGNTLIYGNLSALGEFSVVDTIVTVTSALSVINDGTGPAFTVQQKGAQPIAIFFDDNAKIFNLKNGLRAEFFDSQATNTYALAEGQATLAQGNASHSEGISTQAFGQGSHAEGAASTATGDYSHAEGDATQAIGNASHSEGDSTVASGEDAHAEGNTTVASGLASHAEGTNTLASNNSTHAEGYLTSATGLYSHSEGSLTLASGDFSHAEGYNTTAIGNYSHVQGINNEASGYASHAQGASNVASNNYSHAQGNTNVASGESSHAGGQGTLASGLRSTATGQFTSATKTNAYASGKLAFANHNRSWVWQGTNLDGTSAQFASTRTDQFAVRPAGGFFLSGAMGINTDNNTFDLYVRKNSSGATADSNSIAVFEGNGNNHISILTPDAQTGGVVFGTPTDNFGSYLTWNYGNNALKLATAKTNGFIQLLTDNEAEAVRITSSGNVGIGTTVPAAKLTVSGQSSTIGALIIGSVSGVNSSTSFNAASATGSKSFAANEGHAFGDRSFAEGSGDAWGTFAHAEGHNTLASGIYAHAEGDNTRSFGDYGAHAEGNFTTAIGTASHAEGLRTETRGEVCHAAGVRATAGQNYTYAWSDANLNTLTENVSTTRTGQYMVSASGGVFIPGNLGIGTDNNTNKLTVNGNISASGDAFVSGISAARLTVSENISSNGTLFVKQMSAYGLDLIHTPITDGTDPIIRIGESNYDSPNLGFSGAYMSYDELTNVFGISSVFAPAMGTPAISINRNSNVGIGTSIVPGGISPKLTVNGSISALSAVHHIGNAPGIIPALIKIDGVNILAPVGTRVVAYSVPAGLKFTASGIKMIVTSTDQSSAFSVAPSIGLTNSGSVSKMINDLTLSTGYVHAAGAILNQSGSYGGSGANRTFSTDTVGVEIVNPAFVNGIQTTLVASIIITGELIN
jgi:hypothetical protein